MAYSAAATAAAVQRSLRLVLRDRVNTVSECNGHGQLALCIRRHRRIHAIKYGGYPRLFPHPPFSFPLISLFSFLSALPCIAYTSSLPVCPFLLFPANPTKQSGLWRIYSKCWTVSHHVTMSELLHGIVYTVVSDKFIHSPLFAMQDVVMAKESGGHRNGTGADACRREGVSKV